MDIHHVPPILHSWIQPDEGQDLSGTFMPRCATHDKANLPHHQLHLHLCCDNSVASIPPFFSHKKHTLPTVAIMASVTSLDKDMRKLRLDRYTDQAANEVRSFIEAALGERLQAGDLIAALKDGVALCKYVESLLFTSRILLMIDCQTY